MRSSSRRIFIFLSVLLCAISRSAIGDTQTNAPWGLDRVDQRVGTDGTYTYHYSGGNTVIYVVDTGVSNVADLAGSKILRHVRPADFPPPDMAHPITFQSPDDNSDRPANEHGTKAASIAAGMTYGVAKGAYVVDVRIFNNGSPSNSTCYRWNAGLQVNLATPCAVLAFQYIAQTHNANYPNMKGVVNFSGTLSASSEEMRTAVQGLINQGLTVVVAATESGSTACGETPAQFGNQFNGQITVSAIESDDRLAFDEGANQTAGTGACVDLFAPSSTLAANYCPSANCNGLNYGASIFMHTSSATPFVSGAAALIYQQNPTFLPAQVEAMLKENATVGVLGNIPAGTVNALLYARLPLTTFSPLSFFTGQSGTASVTPISGGTYSWNV